MNLSSVALKKKTLVIFTSYSHLNKIDLRVFSKIDSLKKKKNPRERVLKNCHTKKFCEFLKMKRENKRKTCKAANQRNTSRTEFWFPCFVTILQKIEP